MMPSGSSPPMVSPIDGMARAGLRSAPSSPPESPFNPTVDHGSPPPLENSSDGTVSTGRRWVSPLERRHKMSEPELTVPSPSPPPVRRSSSSRKTAHGKSQPVEPSASPSDPRDNFGLPTKEEPSTRRLPLPAHGRDTLPSPPTTSPPVPKDPSMSPVKTPRS